jgi:3-hydroxybutyryl-CoA dehydratase
MTTAAVHAFESIAEGQQYSHAYVITDAVYVAMTDAFGDRSPIHVDAEVATAAGYEGRVMHGAILNGFVSHFVGMVFPGALSLLQQVDLRYPAPSYLGDRIELQARVQQVSAAARTVVLAISMHNVTRDTVAARGRAQVGVRHV